MYCYKGNILCKKLTKYEIQSVIYLAWGCPRKKKSHVWLSDAYKNDIYQLYSVWAINLKVIGTFSIFILLRDVNFLA